MMIRVMRGASEIGGDESRRIAQRRIGVPRRDKEWRKVGGSVQWRGIRDEKRALHKVEDRGVMGEGT